MNSPKPQTPSPKNASEALGSLCIILSAILFGFMPLLARLAYSHGSNAYTVAFGRFLFGSLFLGLLVLLLPGHRFRISRPTFLSILKAAIPYALVPILLYASYNHIGSGLATTLHFTYPAAVLVILFLVFHRRPALVQLVCVALSLAGIALLYRPGESFSPLGALLAVSSGIVYALYITILGQSGIGELPPLVLAFWISTLSAVEIGVAALLTGNLTFHLDGAGWGAEIALALTATVLALVLFQQGIFLCGEVKASLLSTFEPITSIAVGIVFFQESLTLREGIGILSILFSVLLYAVGSRGQREDKP